MVNTFKGNEKHPASQVIIRFVQRGHALMIFFSAIAFSPDGDLLAICDKQDCKDSITVYSTVSFEPIIVRAAIRASR